MAATHFSGPLVVEGDIQSTGGAFLNGAGSYESVVAARTFVQADNGKTFGLNLVGGGALTMPAAADITAGWRIRMRIETLITTAWIATFTAGEITTMVAVNEHTTTEDGVYDAVGSVITFVAANEVVGDFIDIECNGSHFFVTGLINDQSALTSTGS